MVQGCVNGRECAADGEGGGEKLETAFRRKKEEKKRYVGKSYNYNEIEIVSFCKEYGSAKTGPHSPPPLSHIP